MGKSNKDLLIEAGLAVNDREASGLLKRIKGSGQTVKDYINANSVSSPLAGIAAEGEELDPPKIDSLLNLKSLMAAEHLSYAEGKMLQSILASEGIDAHDYLQRGNSPSSKEKLQMAIFRKAEELVTLAGSVKEAIKAIELFDSVANK